MRRGIARAVAIGTVVATCGLGPTPFTVRAEEPDPTQELIATPDRDAPTDEPSESPGEGTSVCPETPESPDGLPVPAPAGPADLARARERTASLHEVHRFATGAGVTIAIIDTGITPHPLLPPLTDAGTYLEEPYSATGALVDCEGHGTAVASVIGLRPAPGASPRRSPVGVAPDAHIIAIKQSHTSQGGTLDSLGDAINHALDLGADVINLSVSSCLPATTTLAPGVLQEAVTRAEREGTVIVAAAGNISTNCPAESVSYPAHLPTVIAVSALDDAHHIAPYSLPLAGKRALGAPGDAPISASVSGAGYSTSTNITEFRGTSFAAPVITGFVALLKQRHPEASPQELREMVYTAAQPVTGTLDVRAGIDMLRPTPLPGREAPHVSPAHTETGDRSWWPLSGLVISTLLGIIVRAGSHRPRSQ